MSDDRTSGTDFEASWLALRRCADERSRSAHLEERLAQALERRLGPSGPIRIVDLGAGAGANVRHLSPRLAGALPSRPQHWTLVDRDAALLAAAELPHETIERGGGTLEARTLDLAVGLEEALAGEPTLVTASAFLDLVDEPFVDDLLQHARRAVLFICLTVDGRLSMAPPTPDDRAIEAAFARDQATEKIGGRALGPRAAAVLAARARAAGRRVELAPADWVLGSTDGVLQRRFLEGYGRSAVRAGAPAGMVTRWLRRRLAFVDDGQSELRVGHQDLLIEPG